MEQRLSLITIGEYDLKAMTNFYETKFGWQKMDSSNDDVSFFKLNGILFSLYPFDKLAEDAEVPAKGSGFNKFTLAHNVRSFQEVDSLFEDLKQKGVPIIKNPQKVFWGGYSGYVADLENNLWEIAYNPFLKMDKNGNIIA